MTIEADSDFGDHYPFVKFCIEFGYSHVALLISFENPILSGE